MQETQRTFTVPESPSSRGTLQLFSRYWSPETACKATVFGVHGICEHSGRYARFAEDLCRNGYALRMIDLRGHGKSEGPRAHVQRFDQYLEDIDAVLAELEREGAYPDFLLGHSMGAAIMGLYGALRRPPVKGVVLSAPPVIVGGPMMPLLRYLALTVSRLLPGLRLVKMNTPVLMKFGAKYLSHDPRVVEDFRNDPLVYRGRLSTRLAGEVLQASRRLRKVAGRFQAPLLLLHGTGDVIARSSGSELFHRLAGSHDKTLKLYPGFYHEVLGETERDRVIADVIAWLDAHFDACSESNDADVADATP
ncbi:MAG: alpha/beta hydrolase [Planctomycetota bacterium]|nr:MAG: alpha/beta hydrolase [Planctomycetota bacterium]